MWAQKLNIILKNLILRVKPELFWKFDQSHLLKNIALLINKGRQFRKLAVQIFIYAVELLKIACKLVWKVSFILCKPGYFWGKYFIDKNSRENWFSGGKLHIFRK